MKILKYEDAIKNCRFCFMCRHLSGTGNVTFNEADTPRVRAAMLYSVTQKPELLAKADYIDTIYRSDVSAACFRHCVSHYAETALVLAAREDIVDAGIAPPEVAALAAELGNEPEWEVSGEGDVLFFADACTAETPEIETSFAVLAKAAQVRYRVIRGGGIGKELSVLGYREMARKRAAEFAAFVKNLGAKTLVTANPATLSALLQDYREFGIELGVEVLHTSEFIARQNLKFRKDAAKAVYLESDFLRNYLDCAGPANLFAKLGVELLPFGSNDEESYSAGEGAVVLGKLYPCLARKLAERVAERIDNAAFPLVTASPHTRKALSGFAKVMTLEELAARQLEA